MKHGGARANQRGGEQQHRKRRCVGQQQKAAERETHADRERVRHRFLVGIDADERLQQRGGDLERQRDQSDLAEVEPE